VAKRGRKPGTKNRVDANYYQCDFCLARLKTEQAMIKHKTKPIWIEGNDGPVFWGNVCPTAPDRYWDLSGAPGSGPLT
jgi:hypothetical protein